MPRGERIEREAHRAAPVPTVVGAPDLHGPRMSRAVDDPRKALLGLTRGPEQRERVAHRGAERTRHPEAGFRIKQPGARRPHPRAIGRTHDQWNTLPAAAAHPPPITVARLPRAAVARRPHVVVVAAVLHPLPYVAVHVVEPERVRRERAHRRRLPIVPGTAAPVAVGAVGAQGVSPPEARRRPRPRHVLPLRLARQPVRAPRLAREPAHVRLRVVPAHVDHRAAPAPPALVVGTVRAPPGPVARVPLRERDLVHPHRKGRAYRHPMQRAFVVLPYPIDFRQAHQVRARWHHHHLRTPRAVAEGRPHRGRRLGFRRTGVAPTRHRQVGEMSGGRLHRAPHLDIPIRAHEELPLALSVSQATAEAARARFELLRRDLPRPRRRQSQGHLAARRGAAFVVAALNGHPDPAPGEIDQAQPAHLVAVASRVEDRHPMHRLAPHFDRGHDIVHRGQEPVRGTDVCPHLEVEVRLEPQAPVSLPLTQPPGQALRRVAPLQITGVEVPGLPRAQRQRDRPVTPARVIGAGDADRPCTRGVIDDPGKALLDVARRSEKRKDVVLRFGRRCHERKPQQHAPERDAASRPHPSGPGRSHQEDTEALGAGTAELCVEDLRFVFHTSGLQCRSMTIA